MRNRISLTILVLAVLFTPSVRAQVENATPGVTQGVVSYWDKPWGVQLDLRGPDLQGMTLKANGYDADGRRFMLATDNTGMLVVSATLEEVPTGRAAQSCKNIYNERARSS